MCAACCKNLENENNLFHSCHTRPTEPTDGISLQNSITRSAKEITKRRNQKIFIQSVILPYTMVKLECDRIIAIERMRILDEEDLASPIDAFLKKVSPRKMNKNKKDLVKQKVASRYLQSPCTPKSLSPTKNPSVLFSPRFMTDITNATSKYMEHYEKRKNKKEKSPRQIIEERKQNERKKWVCDKNFVPSSYNASKDKHVSKCTI